MEPLTNTQKGTELPSPWHSPSQRMTPNAHRLIKTTQLKASGFDSEIKTHVAIMKGAVSCAN